MLKNYLIAAVCFITTPFALWQPDITTAKQIAKEQHRLILINFSGSDWCGPCIRMHKEIFESSAFKTMADTSLVLLNADFPRNKKHQPPQKIKEQNEMLAQTYNTEGKFPYTVLIDVDGRIMMAWDGLPKSQQQFIKAIKQITDANR